MYVPGSRISVERSEPDLAVVEVVGEHDLSTAPELKRRLVELLGEGIGVVVDLSKTTFIDSSVLATLLEAGRDAAERSIGFAVAVPAGGTDGVRKVVEVTGVGKAVTLADDRATAITTVRKGERE